MSDEPTDDELRSLGEIQSVDELLKVWNDLPEGPLEKAEPAKKFCRHRQVNLNTDNRRVYCRECEAEVDAFSALLTFTEEWERHKDGIARMAQERDRLKVKVNDLKREERNAKARLRRARKGA